MSCRYGHASQPATHLKEELDKEREEGASDRLRKKIEKMVIQAWL
jgi:hypothetical protein